MFIITGFLWVVSGKLLRQGTNLSKVSQEVQDKDEPAEAFFESLLGDYRTAS